jgi:hypothetical protein
MAQARQDGDNAPGNFSTNPAAPLANAPAGDQSSPRPVRRALPVPALPLPGSPDVSVETGTGAQAGDATLAGQPREETPAEPASPTLTGAIEDHDLALSFALLTGLLLSWNGFDGGQEEDSGSQAHRSPR